MARRAKSHVVPKDAWLASAAGELRWRDPDWSRAPRPGCSAAVAGGGWPNRSPIFPLPPTPPRHGFLPIVRRSRRQRARPRRGEGDADMPAAADELLTVADAIELAVSHAFDFVWRRRWSRLPTCRTDVATYGRPTAWLPPPAPPDRTDRTIGMALDAAVLLARCCACRADARGRVVGSATFWADLPPRRMQDAGLQAGNRAARR